MTSGSSSPTSPSPESSTAIIGPDQDDAHSTSGSTSSSHHDSDSSTSIVSHNNQGSVRANDDNGDDGVMVSKDSVGGGSSDEVVVSEDAGREDMFLDASEDLGADGRESSSAYTEPRDNSDNDNEQQIQFRGFETGMQNDYMVDEMERLRAILDKTINEKDSLARECKDEIEMAAKAIACLRDQMRGLMNVDDTTRLGDRFVMPEMGDSEQRETHLHEMIHECQMLIGNVMESRKQDEGVVRQLQDDVSVKNQEIGNLDRTVAELTISRDVVDSYVSSVNNMSMEVQLQKDQYVDDAANRMLTSLASVVYVEQLVDTSLTGKVAGLEKAMFALLENYNWFLYQTDQLRLRLIEVRPDVTEQNDYALVFATSGDELLELKKKEVEFVDKLSYLENEYGKLKEQLDKHKTDAETANAELQKTRAELEQEKNRYLNTKEKLSLAVSKGKALVQQRDSLKQTLADKSTELENCRAELQEKSTGLESAELLKEELVKSQISNVSLQDMLSQKDMLLQKLEEVLLESGAPEELRSMDISDRIRWLVEDRNTLKDVSDKFDSLFSVHLPENVPFSNLESQLGWIKESFDQAKTEMNTLQVEISRMKEAAQDEIDKLTSSLSTVLIEKDCLKVELDDITLKYDKAVESEHQVSSEKEQVLRMLQEVSGVEMNNGENTTLLVQQCIAKMIEGNSSSLESTQVSIETLACMQTLLYVRDQELVLCEQLLEENMQEKSELNRLVNDLKMASEEVAVLKDERDNLRKDLERSEDKSALIREKLSMAVKKGKGLVQEKENLKRLIDEKGAEIEQLRIELQQKESTLDDSRIEIARLSDEVGCIPKLELDFAALRDQRAQIEKDLVESNKLLQSLMEFIDGIVIPLGSESEDPIDKVKWIGEYLNNCRAAKEIVERELQTVKLDAEISASNLVNLNSRIKSLEDALSVAENNISQLVEEKRNLEVSKTSLEDQLRGAVEESLRKASMFTEVTAAKASLESALAQAENTISALREEKEESESSNAAAKEDLANLKEEVSVLRTRLAESASSIKLLEDATTQLESTVAALTEEKNAAETDKTDAVNELQKLKEESGAWNHKLQDALEKIKSLEFALEQAESSLSVLASEKNTTDNEMFTEAISAKASLESALSQAESSISVLRKEKEESESFRATAEEELADLKEEVSVLRSKLTESSTSIKSLEDAATQLETTVSLLTKEKIAAEIAKTNAVNELQKLKEEAGSWDHNLQGALEKIKSLESALEQAESNLSVLANEKNAAEIEIVTLSAKLNTCMEELSGMDGNLKSQSVELFSHLKDLELVVTEEPIVSFLEQCSKKRLEALRAMDLMFRNIRNQLAARCIENLPGTEEVPHISKFLSGDFDSIVNIQFDSDKGEASEVVDVSSYVQRIVKSYRSRHGHLVEKFDLFSNLEDGLNSAVLEEVHGTMDRMIEMADSLKQEIRNLETDKFALENEIGTLKDDVAVLESACADATKELEIDFGKHMLEPHLSSKHHVEIEQGHERNKHTMAAEKLLSATREVHNILMQFKKSESELASVIEEMQDELSERRVAEEKTNMELSLNRSKMSKLETDFKILQDSYDELIVKLEESRTSEVNLGDKEAEISSLRNTLLMKEQEVAASHLWVSQVKAVLDKTNQSEVSSAEKEGGSLEVQDSTYIKKLQYIMENIADLQHQNKILSHEKQELESSADAQLREIDYLKKLCEKDGKDEHELESVKSDFNDLVAGVGRVIKKLGGKGFTWDSKVVATSELVETLEKLVMSLIMESDDSKTRVQDLRAELLANQEGVDELLKKIKVLEDSLQDRAGPSEVIQDRSIFEAPSPPPASEISEIEEVATVAKASISPVPSAAHVRTMRKGLSNDHIALDIASERLIAHDGTDEDKGHVFKSLNASGLIPVQGKMVADRVDGIWVSAGRVLMSRPRARLSLIAYWLLLHIWLLGTIL